MSQPTNNSVYANRNSTQKTSAKFLARDLKDIVIMITTLMEQIKYCVHKFMI